MNYSNTIRSNNSARDLSNFTSKSSDACSQAQDDDSTDASYSELESNFWG